MARNESGCGKICGQMSYLSTSECGTLKTAGVVATASSGTMEMGEYDNKFYDRFAFDSDKKRYSFGGD